MTGVLNDTGGVVITDGKQGELFDVAEPSLSSLLEIISAPGVPEQQTQALGLKKAVVVLTAALLYSNQQSVSSSIEKALQLYEYYDEAEKQR